MVDPLFSFGGIASGLDTNSIIDQLLSIERAPIRRFEQQQRQLRTTDDAWSRIVGRLSGFRDALDEIAGPGSLSGLTTASSSDDDTVSVSSTTGGEPATLSFTVDALAQRHRVGMAGVFGSRTAPLSAGTITLRDETGATLATITTDGTSTLADLADEIDSLGIGVDAQVLKVTDDDHQLVLSATATGVSGQFSVTSTVAELGAAEELSAGTDARLTIGSLVVTRSSNSIDDLIDGARIDLRAVTTSDVTVSVASDEEAVVGRARSFVEAANGLLTQIALETRFDADTGEAGALQGESLARELAFDLRAALTQVVDGGSITYASQVGISLTRDGQVSFDEDTFREALAADPGGVESFLSSSLTGDSGVGLGFVGSAAVDGPFDMTVSRSATVATVTGATYTPPIGTPTAFTITTPNGATVSITLDVGMTAADAVARITAALDAAGDDSLEVAEVDDGGGSTALQLTSAGYGSRAAFTIDGYGADLDGTHAGLDVIADFGEGPVTGTGRSVAGDGAAAGLTLTVTGGVGIYSLQFGSGLSGVLDRYLGALEGTEGRVQLQRDSISGAIREYDEQIEAFEQRLTIREGTLRQQFTALETALQRLQSQGQWLAGALGGLATPGAAS